MSRRVGSLSEEKTWSRSKVASTIWLNDSVDDRIGQEISPNLMGHPPHESSHCGRGEQRLTCVKTSSEFLGRVQHMKVIVTRAADHDAAALHLTHCERFSEPLVAVDRARDEVMKRQGSRAPAEGTALRGIRCTPSHESLASYTDLPLLIAPQMPPAGLARRTTSLPSDARSG